MTIADKVRNAVLDWLGITKTEAEKQIILARDYRIGMQRPQIRIKPLQADDNVIINLCGLVCDRTVSSLFGKGFEINYPGDGDTPQSLYLDAVLDASNQEIMFHRVAQFGAEGGNCYIKIVPREGALPRLIAIDPAWVVVDTDIDDYERAMAYTITYSIGERSRKQVIEINEGGGWLVTDFENSQYTGGRWREIQRAIWPYDFPPILHWQNLPSGGVYGVPDITPDVIQLQDRINFLASNINRIIRYHAHPMRYMVGGGQPTNLSVGPDNLIVLPTGSDIKQLEMQSDLAGSLRFLELLRQSLMDTTRTVDISSMADRLGSLTNFGLRVLWRDALSKIETKRELYGDAIIELLRRLLVINGMTDEAATAYVSDIQIVWPDVLDSDEREEVAALKFDLEAGLTSKKTAAMVRGYDYESEAAQIGNEAAAGDTVGAAILRAFQTGQQ